VLPLALAFARPLGLLALALPLVVLILARRVRRPLGDTTGTLAVWRRVAAEAPPRAGRARLRLSPGLVLLLCALVLGALALAGPRAGARIERTWRVVVDRSPSVHLDGRLVRGLAGTIEWLDGVGGEREWVYWDGAALVGQRGAAPPEAWTRAPRFPHPEPPFEAFDADGTLWVTDADRRSQRAGVFAGGGDAMPGLAAVGERALFSFDGEQLFESTAPFPRRTVVVGPGVPVELAELARLWARARGLTTAEGVDGSTALHLTHTTGAAQPAAAAGRDGWTALGPAEAAVLDDPPHPRPTVWLEGEARALVSWRPGRIDVGWTAFEAVDGDPAAFAVSWSRLFDRALAPPPGVVPVSERTARGEQVRRAPASGSGAPGAPAGSTDGLLAGLAALLVVAALFLRV
jgi:hypothetical protein